ncbi:MAG: helix-turn-helix transcriptional regulator [Candidatus Krumholzibacteria bacterium]|nr:helix-turn-helix transcriptional regulator [Candidatus Krumholzibacteria bacterium]
MIRTNDEFQKAKSRLKAEKDRISFQRKSLKAEGLSSAEIKRAIDPIVSFHLQLAEEVEAYERLSRGEFGEMVNFQGLGRVLISLRIYRGLSQRDLAAKLNVHESQVSRDERNEYHGITVSRAAVILEAMGASLSSEVKL